MAEDQIDIHLESIEDSIVSIAESQSALHHGFTKLLSSVQENTLLLRQILDMLPNSNQPYDEPKAVAAQVFDEMPERVDIVTTDISQPEETEVVKETKVINEMTESMEKITTEIFYGVSDTVLSAKLSLILEDKDDLEGNALVLGRNKLFDEMLKRTSGETWMFGSSNEIELIDKVYYGESIGKYTPCAILIDFDPGGLKSRSDDTSQPPFDHMKATQMINILSTRKDKMANLQEDTIKAALLLGTIDCEIGGIAISGRCGTTMTAMVCGLHANYSPIDVLINGVYIVEREGISSKHPCIPLFIAIFNQEKDNVRDQIAINLSADLPMNFEDHVATVGMAKEFQEAGSTANQLVVRNVYYRNSVDEYTLPLTTVCFDPGGRYVFLALLVGLEYSIGYVHQVMRDVEKIFHIDNQVEVEGTMVYLQKQVGYLANCLKFFIELLIDFLDFMVEVIAKYVEGFVIFPFNTISCDAVSIGPLNAYELNREQLLKIHIQARMKMFVARHRREVSFKEGDGVSVKLQPFRRDSIRLQWLIPWDGMPFNATTWKDKDKMLISFPNSNLADKVLSDGVGNVMNEPMGQPKWISIRAEPTGPVLHNNSIRNIYKKLSGKRGHEICYAVCTVLSLI